MKNFQNFVENKDYDIALNQCASLILEKGINPNAFQELANIYIEWNPLQVLGGVGGSIAGAGLGPAGSLLGATAGSALGRKAGQAVGNFFTKGLAPELTPAFNQAKSSINNLMQVITKTGQQYPQQTAPLTKHVQLLNQALQQIEPQITQTDQGLKTQHGTNKSAQPQGTSQWNKIKQFGGKARDFVGQGSQKVSQWAQKHPGAASALGTAAGAGLGYVAGQAMSGGYGHSGGDNVVPNETPGHSWTSPDADQWDLDSTSTNSQHTKPQATHNSYKYSGSSGHYNDDGTISQTPIPQQAQDIQHKIDQQQNRHQDFFKKLGKKH